MKPQRGRPQKGRRQGLGPRHAPESEERRGKQVASMQVKRLRNALTKQQELCESYVPPERKVRQRVDPNWVLKGAARPAQEYYKPPGEPEPVPENILETYAGRLSEHPQGKILLQTQLELAAALHNLGNKTNDAIQLLKEGMQLDASDAVGMKHALLRLYLDKADGVAARQLIDEHKDDQSSCFKYSLVLLEIISHKLLSEEGSSDETITAALQAAMEANPYTAWYLAYPETFAQVVEEVENIEHVEAGSVEDAFTYCNTDLELWEETEVGCEWVRKYLEDNKIAPPDAVADLEQVPELVDAEGEEDKEGAEAAESKTEASEPAEQAPEPPSEDRLMYAQMFNTAIEMQGLRS